MTIDEQLAYLEVNILEDIKAMSPKDRAAYYQNLKEFERPKLQRSGFIEDTKLPKKITIEIVWNDYFFTSYRNSFLP